MPLGGATLAPITTNELPSTRGDNVKGIDRSTIPPTVTSVKYDAKTISRAKDLLDILRGELPPHHTAVALSVLADTEVDEDCSLLVEHLESVSDEMAQVMLSALQARRCAAEMARTLARVEELERWWICRLPKKRMGEAMDDMDRVVAYVSKSGDGDSCEELLMNWFWLAAGHP